MNLLDLVFQYNERSECVNKMSGEPGVHSVSNVGSVHSSDTVGSHPDLLPSIQFQHDNDVNCFIRIIDVLFINVSHLDITIVEEIKQLIWGRLQPNNFIECKARVQII